MGNIIRMESGGSVTQPRVFTGEAAHRQALKGFGGRS